MNKEPNFEEGLNPKETNIRFEISEDYKKIYANGAYGGMTPRGDLAMDFVRDMTSRPIEQTFEVENDGTLGELTKEESERGNVIRERLLTVFMNPVNARSIAEWILSKVMQVPEDAIHETLQEEFIEEQ